MAHLAACTSESHWNGQFGDPVNRPEHPRPDFRREAFINLNTKWDFAYDPRNQGMSERWFERDDVWSQSIQVPYAWEAPLSGLVPPHEGPYMLGQTLAASTYRGVAWYRLRLPGALAEAHGSDWYLVFGAVDFKTDVWINGRYALTHEGGYDPFDLNLSKYASGDDAPVIVARVEDFTELKDRTQPVGKQGGTWYTRTSGIWQTVYLERRPALHLTSIRIVPEPELAGAVLSLKWSHPGSGQVSAEATLGGEAAGAVAAGFAGTDTLELSLPLKSIEPWDVDSPTLYDLEIRLEADGGEDLVRSYFGLVRVKTDWVPGHSPAETPDPANQWKALFVNGRPRYLRCILDQSYWPDGIYTAPSLEAIRADLETAKSFGLNCVRLHIKMDEPVKYRLLDELGFYVLYDIPALDLGAKNVPGFAGRANFEHVLRSVIRRDASHPSIAAWVVFNENWGLLSNGSFLDPVPMAENPDMRDWVRQMVDLTRSLDPTRPVEDNSAGGVVQRFEHFETDLNSFHYYGADAAAFRSTLEDESAGTQPDSARNFVGGAVQDGDPWFNSEFASFSTFGGPVGAQMYCDLFGLLNEMRRIPKLVGWTLTQLTDVEYELNGLVGYDRSPKPDLCSRHGVELRDVLGDDFIAFEWLPGHEVQAGEAVEVPLLYSHWSSGSVESRRLRLAWSGGAAAEAEFETKPYAVTPIGSIRLDAPRESGPATLVAEVLTPEGRRLCANRLDVKIAPGP